MSETANLQAELERLNQQCQLARDNEVRYALQRSRLEAERATVLAKLVETCRAPSNVVALPALPAPQSYAVRFVAPGQLDIGAGPSPNNAPAATPAPPVVSLVRRKPDNLPTTRSMITAALQESANALRPVEITTYIQRKWWPEMRTRATCAALAHMAKSGKVIGEQGRYRITGVSLNGKGLL